MALSNMRTPGVYITESNTSNNNIVPVETAVPAFIGYTQSTVFNGHDYANTPVRVTSLAEFESYFGGAPVVKFSVAPRVANSNAEAIANITLNTTVYSLQITNVNYRLYNSVKWFYANGGGNCYIVSVGTYDDSYTNLTDNTAFIKAIDLLKQETEPTLLVIPDAVELQDPKAATIELRYKACYDLQIAMLNHCGTTQTRVAILDIPEGYMQQPAGTTTSVEAFRKINTEPGYFSYGVAYYPWLNTNLNSLANTSLINIDAASWQTVQIIITTEFTDYNGKVDPKAAPYIKALFLPTPISGITPAQANNYLLEYSRTYGLLMNTILGYLNLMPPAAAMAGVYTTVDSSKGVWKAPANVDIKNVLSPAIPINDDIQQDLNVPLNGKSICAIRAFPNYGILVWGARTLDGNSQDFRYLNVRRTMIYIEQSIKAAVASYVFQPNTPNTWSAVSSMINNFLVGIWKEGGLAGATPSDAFSVNVGLGTTMTGQDIMNGYMNINILVALTHPAEFIAISIQQQMQA